jgi:type II secretory pathway component PulJ
MKTCVSAGRLSRRGSGTTLVEVLVYLGAAGVVLVAMMQAFHVGYSSAVTLHRQAQQMTRALQAGERWRADVRQASAVPQLEQTSEGLRMIIPQLQGTVFYEFGTNGVYRTGSAPGGTVPVLTEAIVSQVQSEWREGIQVWRWDVCLSPDRKSGRWRPVFTFVAVARVSP